MAIFAPRFSQKNSQSTQATSPGKKDLMNQFYTQMKASVGTKATPVQAQKQQQRLG